jgi:hypothetical protein
MATQIKSFFQINSLITYDFDPCSGEFTSPIQLGGIPADNQSAIYKIGSKILNVNDAVFTPNGRGLYLLGDIVLGEEVSKGPGVIFMDLQRSSKYSINGSATILVEISGADIGNSSLKFGPDNNLYVSTINKEYLSKSIGNINFPYDYATNSSNFGLVQVGLSDNNSVNRKAQIGLPNSLVPYLINIPQVESSADIDVIFPSNISVCDNSFQITAVNSCDNSALSPNSCTIVNWTGSGIIDNQNGFFDPSVAGPGSHTITFTYNNVTHSEQITVADQECSGDIQDCSNGLLVEYQWPSHSNWFFGDGILASFENGNMVFNNVNETNQTHKAYEGASVISDNQGEILMYTNGLKIWDKQGNLIQDNLISGNENGATIASSAAEGVLFVKHPLNNDKAYLFTTDDALTPDPGNGVNYYEVDLITKTVTNGPVRLNDASGQPYKSTEHSAATLHTNGLDIWVVFFEDDDINDSRLFSYRVNRTSINPVPVESVVRTSIGNKNVSEYDYSGRGTLTFSWDLSGYYVDAIFTNNMVSTKHLSIQKLRFDRCIGDFSSLSEFYGGVPSSAVGLEGYEPNSKIIDLPYSVQFSPNGKGLYFYGSVSNVNANGGISSAQKGLYFMDLEAGTLEDVQNSVKLIYSFSSESLGASHDLKLGPNGKLYFSIRNKEYIYEFSGNLDFPFGINGDLPSQLSEDSIGLPDGRRAEIGFSDVYAPWVESIEILAPEQVSNCDDPFNFYSIYKCSGNDVTDNFCGSTGINWSGNGIVNPEKGLFDPKVAGTGSHTITFEMGDRILNYTIVVTDGGCGNDPNKCSDCVSFKPKPNKKYVFSSWVSTNNTDYDLNNEISGAKVVISFSDVDNQLISTHEIPFEGTNVDGWIKLESEFIVPSGTGSLEFEIVNSNSDRSIFIDDIRIHPFNASMVSYIYDPSTLLLKAQLDQNNYYTQYIYDEEGQLIKVNSETLEGVKTMVETQFNVRK